jgi:arylsulfatase A-like enzyme/Flp pilus assembly protein TadD
MHPLLPRAKIFLVLLAVLLAGCRQGAIPRDGGGRAVSLPAQPDVVLVTIDTLRADALSFTGNHRVETPVLDRLAREGWVFTSAHAHNVVTLPSHVNILTGLLPYQHGVRDNSGFRLASSIPTIAVLLKPRGYATGAFIGAFPLDRRFGLAPGFDVYDDRYPRGRGSLDFEMPERPATEVVAAAAKWWAENAGHPRFVWVHLYDCHAPYRPPPPFDRRYAAEPYLGEVAAMDAALAPLFEPLRLPKARPALVVVTADHGEALGEHGEATHGLFAYEATLHVPLIVWMKGSLSGRSLDRPVGHVDIAPTILSAAGVRKPGDWTGSSLLEPRASATAAASYFEAYSAAFNRGWAPLRGILADGWKYVDLPIPELYDESKDPAEAVNLASKDDERLRRLARSLPPESAFGTSARRQPGADEVRRLRSLGYLSGSAAAKKSYGPEDDPKNLVSADRLLHDSVDLYQRGQLAAAIAAARKLVSERPTMAIAYTNLTFLLRQSGAAAEALSVYREAARREILDEELASHYALALSEAGRAADAVRVLQPFSDSNDPDTWNAVGIGYSDSGRPKEATRCFERALELDPGNVDAHENLGIVRLRSGDPSGAQERFRRALSIDSRLPRAWNGIGVAQAQLGEERQAMDSWSRAVALDPKLYDALFNLGLTAGKNGLRHEARQALERFVATAPPDLYRDDIAKARSLLRGLATKPS